MKRVSPEYALRQHEMDVEAEKSAARLNLLINSAVFVAIVGAIRIGNLPLLLVCHVHSMSLQGLMLGDM